MSSKKSGNIIVVVAPSGTGKSSLIERVKKEFVSLKESVSFTTREKRDSEKNGIHYNFITREEFEAKIDSHDFLEWALVHGEYKGTSKSFVESQLSNGQDLLFDLDVQGADSIREYFKDRAKIIFIEPPSFEELENRLRSRNTESEDKINTRLRNAKTELERKNDYDFLVTNDVFDKAYLDLAKIIKSIIRGN